MTMRHALLFVGLRSTAACDQSEFDTGFDSASAKGTFDDGSFTEFVDDGCDTLEWTVSSDGRSDERLLSCTDPALGSERYYYKASSTNDKCTLFPDCKYYDQCTYTNNGNVTVSLSPCCKCEGAAP